MDDPRDVLELLDYRRRVADLYHHVRHRGADVEAWRTWRTERDLLFAEHRQSPYDEERRAELDGLAYFDHDPGLRFEVQIEPADPGTFVIGHSSAGGTEAHRVGQVSFVVDGTACRLSLFWLDQYGGGLFLPFRDATNGATTYGGGRYLLDTAKSADLGSTADGRLIIDLNFAYHPSCYHDPRWSCPLAPPENRLDVPVAAGERTVDDG